MPGSPDSEKPKQNEAFPSKTFENQREMKVPSSDPTDHTILPGGEWGPGTLGHICAHIYMYIYVYIEKTT